MRPQGARKERPKGAPKRCAHKERPQGAPKERPRSAHKVRPLGAPTRCAHQERPRSAHMVRPKERTAGTRTKFLFQPEAHQGSNREKDKAVEVKESDWSPLNLF